MFEENRPSLQYRSTRLLSFYRGRNNPDKDYCFGGHDIYNASMGFNKEYWEGLRDPKGVIYIRRKSDGKQYIIDEVPKGNGNFTFCFDNNMRPIVCVQINDSAMLRWYDPTRDSFVIDIFSNLETPFIRIDDCLDTIGNTRDAVLFYEREDKLYFRLLRDRFTIEHFFCNISPWQILYQCGMNIGRRFQCDLVWDHNRIAKDWARK